MLSRPSESAPNLRVLCWAAAAGAAVNAFRSIHFDPGTLAVDPYWVGFYLDTYRDGYRRRALIGTLCRHIFPAGVPVVAINIVAVLVLAACFILLFRALAHLAAEKRSPYTTVAVFALAASTLTASFYETLGDLLHIALLLFAVGLILAVRKVRAPLLRMAIGVFLVTVCFFIHEATLFLLIPALPFFLEARPRARSFILPLLLYAAFLGLSMHWSNRVPHPSYGALLWHHGTQAAAADTPTFRNELETAHRLEFATPERRLYFAGRILRVSAIALAYLAALALALPRRTFARTLFAGAVIVFASLPLWVVAFDWGRFLTLSLVLALLSTALWQHDPTPDRSPDEALAPPSITRLANRVADIASDPIVMLAALFALLLAPEFPATHVDSMSPQTATAFYILLGVAFLAHLTRRPNLTI